MKYKQIIPCIWLKDAGVAPEAVIDLDNKGADRVLLIEDSLSGGEEALIKLIKAVSDKSDMPLMVKYHYGRLEDVKKILYAGASHVVMDAVSNKDFRLMEEVVARFGSEKILAWLPLTQPLNNALVDAIKQCGAGGCVAEHHDLSSFKLYHMPVFPVTSEGDTRVSEELLRDEDVHGIILDEQYSKKADMMDLKAQIKSHNIAVNSFESTLPFSEFKLNSDGLIPVVTQDYKTGKVLMVAYMNEEAFNETIRSGRMTYWSRSRQELWKKGDTSGHYQYVKSLDIDCDKDTILAKVLQIGAACHTGSESCFFTNLASKPFDSVNPMTILDQVMETIQERKRQPKEGSYTNYLFDKGIDKILKKVGEEATEIVIAAKNPDSDELKYEICDFLYHMMVLMAERDVTWKEITRELAERH
ncbi:MAG: bifunctional phosphoribosyl-AMP cyclohydrolase/phosphoribosyl-ATP diphosphatase HisIE [Clostridia bacterium]|nr:bifunctional phosphoribosyl-AMP cyclohydrolase/phosphoribosyl-ATP diphosphatase HisIE [Lachnospiraceae bacterium]NCC00901.1 bifunctional phosphoribosyl-AMP cyclohydrolase/phosphoribosyl-ATP diphosphatase HisIE [Clostridia bacterium]NCD03718.1 bifunctional phosphoribosyl-AMP cyclohydrolase/phosphoribosyl-ATP diphosphatase HisIE [Clostridia bacterium]